MGQKSARIALLLLAACGGTAAPRPPVPGRAPDAALEGRVVFEASPDPADLLRGDLARVRIRVANHVSNSLLVLGSISIEPSAPAGVPAPEPTRLSFQTSRRGSLRFDRDAYRLGPSLDSTDAVFNSGALFPRESLSFTMPVRVLEAGVRVRLEYDLLPYDRAAEAVHFPAGGGEFRRRADLASMAPRQENERRVASEVLFIRSLALGKPAAESVALSFRVRDGAYPLASALRAVPPGAVEAVTHFTLHGSWMIRVAGETYLAHPAGVTRVPNIEPSVVDLVDAIRENVVEVEFDRAGQLAFAGTYEIVASKDNEGRVRSCAFIPKADFVGFLAKMRDLGRKWRVDLRFRNGRPVPFVTY